MSVSDYPLADYDQWLHEEWRYTENTAAQYLSAARNLRRFLEGDDVTIITYREWLEWLQDSGYAPSSVNEYHVKCQRYLDFLDVGFDPGRALGVLPDEDADGLPDPLEREHLRAMREVAETPEEEALVVLLYHTGLRNSELRELTWRDVDFQKGDLSVQRRKKRGWARDTLPLYDDQLSLLEDVRDWRDDDNSHIFPARESPKGIGARECPIAPEGSLSATTVNRYLRNLANEGRVARHIWAHLFRHTRATHMLEDGESVDYVNQWMDHEKMETTLQYARLTGESLRKNEVGDSSTTFE